MFRKWTVLLVASLTLAAGCNPTSETAVETESSVAVEAVAESEGNMLQTDTHIFEEIADGVYFATGTGTTVTVASNALVIVNEEDVVLIDSHITADAARELVRSVQEITDKPIRYVVNSHFHFDQAHGNQIFSSDVDIIGHEYTRQKLLDDPLSEQTYQVIGSPEAQSQLLSLPRRTDTTRPNTAS